MRQKRGFGAGPKGERLMVPEVDMLRIVHKAWIMQHVCGALVGRLTEVDPAFSGDEIAKAMMTIFVLVDEYLDTMSDQSQRESVKQFVTEMTSDGPLAFPIICKEDGQPQSDGPADQPA